MGSHVVAVEASAEKSSKKKSRRKRRDPEPDAPISENIAHDDGELADGTQIDDNEPTMAEKLASLELERNDKAEMKDRKDASHMQPPSADSVYVLLKQALHADDRALLLQCLYNQDDKVIANSVLLLNPSDVFKLLDSLISIIQSRGAVVMCTLPWLKRLLLQHSTWIMSQESSRVVLNSLYQHIESRVASLVPAMELAGNLDVLFTAIDDDEAQEEFGSVTPAIFEDDDSEEDEPEKDVMDTDDEDKVEPQQISDISDGDGGEDLSD